MAEKDKEYLRTYAANEASEKEWYKWRQFYLAQISTYWLPDYWWGKRLYLYSPPMINAVASEEAITLSRVIRILSSMDPAPDNCFLCLPWRRKRSCPSFSQLSWASIQGEQVWLDLGLLKFAAFPLQKMLGNLFLFHHTRCKNKWITWTALSSKNTIPI